MRNSQQIQKLAVSGSSLSCLSCTTWTSARMFEVHSVEGRVRQPIVNYNDKQIALLSKEDLVTINTQLKEVPELMAHFGYEYISV